MSLAYCFYCLERSDQCECKHKDEEVIYGDLRRVYIQGYRDGKEGKEMDI